MLKQYYPLYDTVLAQVEGARYWKVKIPSDIFQGVSEVFLKIDYEGDTQAVYLNSKLIADNFFAGEPMILGLKRFEVEVAGNELVLIITPLADIDSIYLEPSIKQQFMNKFLAPKINKIEIIPQYETEFIF